MIILLELKILKGFEVIELLKKCQRVNNRCVII